MGAGPAEYLDRYNPTFGPGDAGLARYVTDLGELDAGRYWVLVINNSASPYDRREAGMLGVLHQATVGAAGAGEPRWINTIMLATSEGGAAGPISDDRVRDFVESGAYQTA